MDTNIEVVPLSCAVQTYAWGKVGDQSTVAALAKNQAGFTFDQHMPYAELWMGSHPKGPSKLINMADSLSENNSYLGDWITQKPSVLGTDVYQKFGANLPFLFKVLSVNKSLSIQAHPTKEHAEILHQERPDVYPDPNHKPEMAIALTRFEALCGFRPASEILNYFHEVQEFLAVVGQEAVDGLINAEMATEKSIRKSAVHKALKHCMTCLMECDPNILKIQLANLVKRLNECHEKREDTTPYLGRLFLRIHNEYPGDVGCFVIYFLNHIILEPYESIFLGPNVPHAYLAGDIIECMAASDNVVRAGLTPKYKDVATLTEMLNYTPQTVLETKFLPTQDDNDKFLSVYNAPVDDFSVRKIQIPSQTLQEYDMKVVHGPSILLTMSGKADLVFGTNSTKLCKGSVLFISSGTHVSLKNIAPDEEVLLFQAYCDLQRT